MALIGKLILGHLPLETCMFLLNKWILILENQQGIATSQNSDYKYSKWHLFLQLHALKLWVIYNVFDYFVQWGPLISRSKLYAHLLIAQDVVHLVSWDKNMQPLEDRLLSVEKNSKC